MFADSVPHLGYDDILQCFRSHSVFMNSVVLHLKYSRRRSDWSSVRHVVHRRVIPRGKVQLAAGSDKM